MTKFTTVCSRFYIFYFLYLSLAKTQKQICTHEKIERDRERENLVIHKDAFWRIVQ